jgi:hypothetical protein
LIVGNQASKTIAVFAVGSDGGLSPTAAPLAVAGKPTFVSIFAIAVP